MPSADPQHRWLERLYDRYHRRCYLALDPLAFLDRWPEVRDREVGGLLAALLAFGNVRSILAGVEDLLGRIGPEPRRFLDDSSTPAIRGACRGFRYRWVDGGRMAALLVGVKRVTAEHGSLEAALPTDAAAPNAALDAWVERIVAAADDPLTMLLPRPGANSACKRLRLYLRWMVRRDAIDPGGWSRLSPDQLVAPLDTHLLRVARTLGWTARRQASGRTAMQVTAALRRACPADPLRYDFALTRPGIRREPLPVPPRAVNLANQRTEQEGACLS